MTFWDSQSAFFQACIRKNNNPLFVFCSTQYHLGVSGISSLKCALSFLKHSAVSSLHNNITQSSTCVNTTVHSSSVWILRLLCIPPKHNHSRNIFNLCLNHSAIFFKLFFSCVFPTFCIFIYLLFFYYFYLSSTSPVHCEFLEIMVCDIYIYI